MVNRNGNKSISLNHVQELLKEDGTEEILEELYSHFHEVPFQFKERIIDYFARTMTDFGPGAAYNRIRKMRDQLLPKSDKHPKSSEKSAELAMQLLEKEEFLTMGERAKTIFHYNRDSGIWTENGRSFIEQWIQRNADPKDQVNTHLVNETVAHIERETGSDKSVFDVESEEPCLVLKDCLYCLDSGRTPPFRPDLYARNKLNISYDPKADCPTFRQFLSEILSPEDVIGVQEEFGAILRKKYLTKKFSIYLGEPDTGKTTLISVMLRFLGAENISNVSIQDLASRNPFQTAPLYGKMANIRDDLSKDVIYSSGKLKEVTGGFPIQGERKFQEQFSFANYAYMIFTCNSLPPLQEDDDGFFVRVIIRIFAKRFGGKDKPDRTLINKLTTEKELSGILNWAIEGYERLKDNGWNFTNTASLDVTYEDYKRRSDPVWAFVQDWISEESDVAEPKEALYGAFKLYCKLKGIPLISKDLFYKTLPSKVNVSSEYRTFEGLGRKHSFVGIRLNDNYHLNKEKSAQVEQVDHQKRLTDQGVQGVQGSSNLIVSGITDLMPCIYVRDFEKYRAGEEGILDFTTFENLKNKGIVREESDQERRQGSE